jgi:HSP20 family protein
MSTTPTDTRMSRSTPGELEQVREGRRVRPAVDIYENRDEILLYADLPGVAPADLHVHLDDGLLSIEGHRHFTGEPEQAPGLVYQRRFQLAGGLDADKIKATLKNGVLELHLPKMEAVKPRQIRVEAK